MDPVPAEAAAAAFPSGFPAPPADPPAVPLPRPQPVPVEKVKAEQVEPSELSNLQRRFSILKTPSGVLVAGDPDKFKEGTKVLVKAARRNPTTGKVWAPAIHRVVKPEEDNPKQLPPSGA